MPFPSARPTMRLAACLVLLAGGCASPLEQASTRTLRESVVEAARRELAEAARSPDPTLIPRRAGDLPFSPERLRELEEMAGPGSYPGAPTGLGPGLLGEPAPVFRIDLRQSIVRAVRQNLEAQRGRLDPAIGEARAVSARAAFDWVFFTNVDWAATDAPQVVPVVSGVPIGAGARQAQSIGYETGIRKVLTSGGALAISQGQTYTDDTSPGIRRFPDPANQTFLDIALSQPLLRGFGSDAALAQVRLAENVERRGVYAYKSALIRVATETERAYWQLAFSARQLQIRRRLLDRGIETRDVLASRLDFDVRPAEYADAIATVESRRADLIRAENALRLRSDSLKALINDDDLTVGGEALLLPAEDPPEQPITFSLLDSVTTALARRPEIQQAILAIDDASIRQRLADNARLPALDLAFRTRFQGLADSTGEAYEDISDARFVDYILSAAFEQPIGNRGPEAEFRARQLERMQATVEYRAAVQRVVLEVKAALRNVVTNYQLIEQTRTARIAAAENLRTLLVLEETVQSLTPDFLDLKFRRQQALAEAELQEQLALTDYNISLADLAAATGTSLERSMIEFVVPDAPATPARAR